MKNLELLNLNRVFGVKANMAHDMAVLIPMGYIATFFITSTIALFVYMNTLAPDLTWDNFGVDGGELITATMTGGVPHPSGYPTYLILGRIFGQIPIGTFGFRFNFFSAFSMAVAAGFITLGIFRGIGASQHALSIRQVGPAVAAGLSFAFAPLVWGQAIITEVYALNLAFVSILIWILMIDSAKHHPVISGAILGLCITTHLTSLLLIPLLLILVPRSLWLYLLVGTFLGLLPYLALPILGSDDSPLVWGQLDSVKGWWWQVSSFIYRPNTLAFPSTLWAERLVSWLPHYLSQYTWFGIILITLGIYQLRNNLRLVISLLGTIVAYSVYAFMYNTSDALVFSLPGLLLTAVFLGFGLTRLKAAALLLPLVMVTINYNEQDLGQAYNLRIASESLLGQLPAQSIVLTPGDQTISALWYYHYVEGQRSDLVLVDSNMFQFDWYRMRLGRLYPDLVHLERDDLEEFILFNKESRPICKVSLIQPLQNNCQGI
jgi:hypothetical protein